MSRDEYIAWLADYEKLSTEEQLATFHPPTLLEQAGSIAKAVVHQGLAGFPAAPPEVKAARLAVCSTCPEFDAAKDQCAACGCRLGIKAGWATTVCPDGKWLR